MRSNNFVCTFYEVFISSINPKLLPIYHIKYPKHFKKDWTCVLISTKIYAIKQFSVYFQIKVTLLRLNTQVVFWEESPNVKIRVVVLSQTTAMAPISSTKCVASIVSCDTTFIFFIAWYCRIYSHGSLSWNNRNILK